MSAAPSPVPPSSLSWPLVSLGDTKVNLDDKFGVHAVDVNSDLPQGYPVTGNDSIEDKNPLKESYHFKELGEENRFNPMVSPMTHAPHGIRPLTLILTLIQNLFEPAGRPSDIERSFRDS